MHNSACFTQCHIIGLTLNPYQVEHGNEQADVTVKHLSVSIQGDFMEMPFDSETFDTAYAIEATCHAPDWVGVYHEIWQVLKLGSIFACYESCVMDHYIPRE